MPNFRSKLEELTAALLKKNKIKFEYEKGNIEYDFKVRGGRCNECESRNVVRKRRYLPDFTLSDGRVVESKGKLTPSERTKFLAIRESNPGIYIAFVFGANNKLNKRKAKRYSDWCEQYGFDYGIKELPASLTTQGS